MSGDIIALGNKKNSKATIQGVGGRTNNEIIGERSSIFYNESLDGVPRREDLFATRFLGQTSQIQLLKDLIKNQVASTDFQVRPETPEDEEPTEEQVQAAESIEQFLDGNFNQNNQSFDDLLKVILDDVLDFDSGVVELVSDNNGYIQQIIPRDGLTFTKNVKDNGLLPSPDADEPAYYQFSLAAHAQNLFSRDRQGIDIREITEQLTALPYSRIFSRETKEFARDQIVWFSESPVSYEPYGFGRTQKVKSVAENMINGDMHRNRFFTDNEYHKGFLKVTGETSQQQKKAIKEQFSESAGNEYEFNVLGLPEGSDYVSIDPEPEKMQFLESQKWYTRITMITYGANDAEAGLLENANKGISEQARLNMRRRTTEPLLNMIERKFNDQILPFFREYEQVDGKVKFDFDPEDFLMKQAKTQLIQDKLANGTMTLNEAREELGKEPYNEVGDVPKQVLESYASSNPASAIEELTGVEVQEDESGSENPFENLNINLEEAQQDDDDSKSVGKDSTGQVRQTKSFEYEVGDFVQWEFGGGTSQGEIIDRTDQEGDSLSAGGNTFTVEDSNNALYKMQEWDETEEEFTNNVVKFEDELSTTGRPEEAPETAPRNRSTETKQTFDDYPQEAVENARTALEARDNEEFDNDECGTRTGWERANQLDNGESLSLDTVERMHSFFERHDGNQEVDEPPKEEDCGWLTWKAWGGRAAFDWATEILEELEDQEENSRSGSGSTEPAKIENYREAFENKDKVLEATKDALRNEQGFDDVKGIVEHKEEFKDDVAEVFESIDLDEQLRQEFPDEEQDGDLLVNADEIVNSVEFRDRLGSVIETNNLGALEMSAEHHEEDIERETEERLTLPDESKVEISFDVIDTFTADIIRQEALSAATEVEGSIKDRLKNEILRGAEEGESIREIRDRITDVKDSISRDHAELVARTETLQSSRKGSQALAESTDLVDGKEWLATDDSRTRAWHDTMDGTIVGKGDLFTVPNVSNDQPNDYPRSVRVVGEDQPFNCRCSQAPVLAEDMPDNVEQLQADFDNVTVDLGLPTQKNGDCKKLELWRKHSTEDETSFKQFWKRVTDQYSKSEIAEKFEMSKTTVYNWSE